MPSPLSHPQDHPFSEVESIAIAIKAATSSQRHVGILFRGVESETVHLLHFAWDRDLRCQTPQEDYLWVQPPLSPLRARQVAARCKQIKEANTGTLPYAFSAPNDCFDEATGAYLFGPKKRGLTCATFVLAVFHASGLPLVAYDTWPKSRAGDTDWKIHIIGMLRARGASVEHLAHLSAEFTTIRYRPEDVAGAAACATIPAEFESVSIVAAQIIEQLK